MSRSGVIVALFVAALLLGSVPAGAGPKGGPKHDGGSTGDTTGSGPIHLTSLCDGPRDGATFTLDGSPAPADLACDTGHGIGTDAATAIGALVSPTVLSDCAAQGSWRPGNSHPCPHGSIGLSGTTASGYAALFAWPMTGDEAESSGYDAFEYFTYDADEVRFRNAAGGVVTESAKGALLATSVRLYLHAYPDGEKYATDRDDPALAIGCELPAGRAVTLQLRRDDVGLYPARGDRAVTRNGPVALISIGDVVLTPADDLTAPAVVIDATTPGSCTSPVEIGPTS